MTTERRRASFKPYAFLAAFGLALALSPSPARALTSTITSASTAPYSADSTSSDVPVLYFDATATGGSATFTPFQVSMFGDAPPQQLSVDIWRDNGDGVFSSGSDTRISSNTFSSSAAPVGGAKAAAFLSNGEVLPPATPTRYFVTVRFNGVPPGRKLSFGFNQPGDFGVPSNNVVFPLISSATIVRLTIPANPINGANDYAFPVAGATNSGGLDTGLFVHAGQRVSIQAVPGDAWNVPASTNADGGVPTGGLGSFNLGALVGRVGSGAWQLLGQSSTITVSNAGTLYVAPNDTNYSDNSGFIRAAFDVQPSTTNKRWIGGVLGFETSASIDGNWLGGRPYDGEHAIFDVSSYDCDWDLNNVTLADLFVSTAYTKAIRLVSPPYQYGNRLTTTGDATIRGGSFQIGVSTAGPPVELDVNGRLVVRDTATFVLGGILNLGLGGELRAGAVMLNAGSANIGRAIPSQAYYMRVVQATMNLTGVTTINGSDYIDFSTPTILALDNLTFTNYAASTSPLVRFGPSPVSAYTFNNWSSLPPARTPGVDAAQMPPGSAILFNGSITPANNSFGSPNTTDPNHVVRWLPDGGGPTASIAGFLTSAGGTSATFRVIASTSPSGNDFTGIGGGGGTPVTLPGSGAYTISGLRAPSTYFLFAYIDDAGAVGAHSERGGYGHPGSFRSDPLFLPPSVTTNNINITMRPWGAVAGGVQNLSNQNGPIYVETWEGLPNLAISTRQARGVFSPITGSYLFQTAADFGGVLHSSAAFAFVDANQNGVWDVFEASGTVNPVSVTALSTANVNINIVGGNPAPGGAVTVATAAVHYGVVGSAGPQALIRARLTASVSTAALAGIKLRYQGPPPAAAAQLSVWADDGDGLFSAVSDQQLGSASVSPGGASTATVQFSSVAILQAGVPRDFFLALDLNGASAPVAGLLIDAATSFTLAAGTFTVTPAFPVQTGVLPVYKVVKASETAYAELSGGAPTGFFVYSGQQLTLLSTGTWKTGPSDSPTGPGGAGGTTGLNTVLPAANRGELIGRVRNAVNSFSSPWFRVGASTTIPAPTNGELVLAINDFINAYSDNSGEALSTFTVSGSTLGAIIGQVFYAPPASGSTITVSARLGGTTVLGQATMLVTGSTWYPFFLPALPPGNYDLAVTNNLNSDFGRSGQLLNVQAGATTTLNAVMYAGTGTISGSFSYSGVVAQGDFHIGVATVTDFSGNVNFFGSFSTPAPSGYTITSLPAPATYYVVAYRDGNGDNQPDGPEPLGYYGVPGAGLYGLSGALTPVYLGVSGSSFGVNMALNDLGAIVGSAVLSPSATGTLVIETGRGIPGSAGYTTENRQFIPVPAGGPPAAGLSYSLGLLRPSTSYSVFAYLDKNSDGQPSAGEEQMTAIGPISVPPGALTHFDFSMVALSSPAAPSVFTASPALVSTITFSWNLVPGATGYQLRRANNSVFVSLPASASDYFDVLPDNTSSQIRSISASNGNGTSTTTALSGPVYTNARIPGVPSFSAVSSTGSLVSWSANSNPPGTGYELDISSSVTALATPVFVGTSTAYFSPLRPAATAFYVVRAKNGGGVNTGFSASASVVTNPQLGPSLYGILIYQGGQTAGGHGFVLEVSTSSANFFPRVSSTSLPGAPAYPFFLPVAAGTYYVRGYVDLAGNGVLQPNADIGQLGPFVVAASSVNASFLVSVDTVPPGAPAGLLAVPATNKVTVSWVAPTKNANGTNLLDLAGYVVERSTALGASFVSLTPTALSSGTSSFADTAPVAGLSNYYRVRAVDLGGSQSAPSGVVGAVPSSGGSISGAIRSFSSYTAATDGQFRVRLSTSPSASAPSVAEASLTSYTFTSLADGIYYLRAFRDLNGNGVADPLTEPAGTFGGLNQPFPIAIVNGNAVAGADATICDRSPLTLPSVSGALTAAGCPALDKGPGFTTSLFAFTVGGGASSFGLGTQLNLSMSTNTAFSSDIILLGPDGSVFGRDNRVGGANLTSTLNVVGTYLVEPTSFLVGGAGGFLMKARFDGGFGGVIAGSVTYSGARTGLVYAQLFNSSSQQALPILTSTSASVPASFSFTGLPDGNYFLRAFRDSNGNGVSDGGDPAGQFGVSASSSLPALIAGGQAFGGPFIVPITDPAVGVVRGSALYEGSGTGALRVEIGHEACLNCSSIQTAVAFTTVAPGGVYTLSFIPAATDYVVRAIADFNGNGQQDALEPSISSFPVTVFVNATSTVSLIVRDAGTGSFGGAIVVGTVTYSGASTGPILIGLSHDPQFHSVDYLLVRPATGAFSRAGLQGDTTYYMAGFIDTNLNNNPDTDLGEPAAAGSTVGYVGVPSLDSPPMIYVSPTGATGVQLQISDPPNASVLGTVRYAGGAPVAQNLVVQASRASSPETKQHRVVIPRVPGVSTYTFRLDFLDADAYYINAYIDANGNQTNDFGEPFGSRSSVSLSSGAGSFPTYGADLEVLDPGSLGAALSAGEIRGDMVYLGTQSGDLFVRFFGNDAFLGSPLYTLRVPAPSPGSGEFTFDRTGLPFGTYYLDAFRDPSNIGIYNPAANAYGQLNEGSAVTVSQEQPTQYAFGGTISDPGMGGSVNVATGSFAAAGGVRFDGGATDLGAVVKIDSTTSGPQPIVLGVSAQNDGVDSIGIRFSSTGVLMSSAVITSGGDLQIGEFAIDALSKVYISGRIEDANSSTSTGTLTVYDSQFGVYDYAEFPGHQGFNGLAYAGGYLYAGSRYEPTNVVHALKIDPSTLLTIATGTFTNPGSCQFCQTRVQGAAVSPNGAIFVVYGIVNQQSDSDRGLHFLLKFDSGMNLIASKDITSLGGPVNGGGVSMTVDNSGALYLVFTTDGNTARTYKYDVSGAVISQTAAAAYGPINVHFSGGLGNVQLDPASGRPFEVWESTTNGGDYMLLGYDQSLNLVRQRFFDGKNNTLEDTGLSLAVYNSSMVFVSGAVNNGQNLDWGVVSLNGNTSGATSAAGPAVTITTANAVNYIAGTVTYGGALVTSGTIRTALIPTDSNVPIRFDAAPFGASRTFLFNNVPDGEYDVRSFIDPNNNQNADEGEPAGVTTLLGIDFSAQTGSQNLADPVQLCDRRQIAFGVDVVQSLTATDCTSPDRTGAPRRLYTFRGTRGQPVTIRMNALGFYDSYLDLYGPDGDWLEFDDDGAGNGDAQITNFVLPADGVYTIDAGAYGSGSFGQFKLALSGSVGALGGISGSVNYAGSQGGAVVVGLFNSTAFSSATTVGRQVLTSTRAFSFSNLSVGTTYYLGAFIDVNANGAPDAGEDSGVFGQTGAPSPLSLASGQFASGVEIAVYPSTASAASAAYVTGTVSYAGTRTGPLVLEFWSSAQFTGHPIASRVIPTGVGAYDVAVPGGVPYFVRGYIDANADFALQPDEPRGVYAPHGQVAEQVFAPVGQTLVGIDLAVKDPGLTASGAIAGEGTAVLASTSVVTGAPASVTLVYTAGPNGVAGGGTAGSIGFTVPSGFPFPVASAAGSSVTVTSTGPVLSAVTYSGPSAFVTVVGGGGLLPGQQVLFQWTNFPVPCQVGTATFTVSEVQNNTASPQGLFLGSPSLAVVSGAPSYAALDQPYFSVKQGELSDIHRLVTYDVCGARAPVTSTTTIGLAGRFFNGSSFVTDALVGVTTNTALSTGALVSVDFGIGQSSQPFYMLAASTGFKYLEIHSPLGVGSTYYFGVTAVPANALTNVSISTASSGSALSSATIALAASGQPVQLFVNFTLGDPQQPWHVLVSSLPFKSGESPNAVWETWGNGQPSQGQIAWDGRFSPWIQGGGRVPNGLYYGRVELGGGGVKDDTLRVTVALPQFAGRAFDPGTVPNPPLSGVQLNVYGPSGYYTAASGSDGAYVIPGLGAGNYRLNMGLDGYVQGAVDMTLNASGAATSFVPRTPGVLVSSNATGGLDLFIGRAPRLIVVPSLDPSVGAVAADQWGSLQVRPSTSTQQSTFYGPMRLKGGTTTFDDGGQWDSSTQQFVSRTLLGFNVPVGTYTVQADLSGYSSSTGSVYVGPDGSRLDLTPFLPKGVISGQVNVLAAPAVGMPVSVTAIALSSTVATTGLSGGAFISAGSTYAVYSISGFDPGSYLLRANTQGLSAVTTGPIVVVGTAAVSGADFPNFGAGAPISGTISVVAPNGTQIFVNAWSPGSFNFGSTVVYVNANSAAYALPGLDAGATYQLYANINAQSDYALTAPLGGFPIKVFPPNAAMNFTLSPASGVVAGTILLRAGSTDFTNVILSGITTASLHPDDVGHTFTQVSTSMPNFLCGDGSSGATGYCPAGVSSATFRVTGLNTQTVDIRFLHSTTGQIARRTISIVNGSTFAVTADLSASTFSISGSLINQISDTFFNTNDKIVANAPYILPQGGYPSGVSSTTARVTATRQDIDAFGVAISTVFDPISTRVGFLDVSGNFTIPNCSNGVYVVRTADLRSCATCAIIAPSVGRVVSVSGASVSSVTLTVSNGYSVSGTLTLDGGMLDAAVFNISVLNSRQEIVRSTSAYLGDIGLGQAVGSVDYAFTNLPAGEFYTLLVSGLSLPVKYVARPIKFPDPALSPTGLQSNLTRQDVVLPRAAYVSGRLKDGGTGVLIGAANATLLAPNFAITATANPWTEGGFVTAASSVSARPIQADDYFRVGPLLPGVSYDLRLAQATWDPNFLASGSQNYAPVTIGGLKLTSGEIRDIGVVALGQGQSVTGVVSSTATGLPLGNIKVTAAPSFGGADLVVQTFTSQQGVYSLWVSTLVSNQFTLTAAPRDGNQASDGRYYGTVSLTNVNLQTQTSANFLLTPLTVVVTGQIVVADAATGGALSYPFGDKRGFPAAAVNLQPVGVVPSNPLGDIQATSDERGFFSVPGLSTGIFALHATSLGYAVFNATVQVAGSGFHIFTGSNTATNDLPGGVATLTRGATATGRVLKSDGTAPNSTEVVGVAAANFAAGEFVVGSVAVDPVAKTVNAYTISGFKTGVPYNIVLLSGAKGQDSSFPPEGAGVVFSAAESSTTKTINLTYRPAALDCLGTAKALDAARTQFAVQIDCLKPLRQETAADDDLTTILTVSTFTQAGSALTSPNGSGVLSARTMSTDRRRLTGTYTLAASETRFTMRVRASASEVDPRTGDHFAIDKVFDFYGGLEAHSDGRATNINGGAVAMQPSAQDELLGLDERSRIDLPPGAFGEGADSLADSSVVAQPTTTVNVSMTKGRDQQLAKALSVAAVGYAPAALSVADVPSAFPPETWAAMSKYRTQTASTSTVGGANPLSAFYSIFLPAGIRHQLKERADLTLSYNTSVSTGTTDDKIQVWFYNAVLGRFVLENVNRRLDDVAKTITVSVDHFSTFVVLDSTPVATSGVTFGGSDIAVANFPNPADCITHANIAQNATLFGAGGVHAPFVGTMIRTSIPGSDSAPLKINIYTVAGQKVRTIDQGDLPGGKTYYTPWNCANDAGSTVASGVYIGEAVFGGKHKFFKIAIIKGSGL